MREVMNAKEAAEYVDLHYITVLRRLAAGKFPGSRVGSAWRVSKEDLVQFIRNGYQWNPSLQHEEDLTCYTKEEGSGGPVLLGLKEEEFADLFRQETVDWRKQMKQQRKRRRKSRKTGGSGMTQ